MRSCIANINNNLLYNKIFSREEIPKNIKFDDLLSTRVSKDQINFSLICSADFLIQTCYK